MTGATLRPVLGLVCCTRAVGAESGQVVMNRYVVAAADHADASALLVPSVASAALAADVAPRIDGLLLTGSPSNLETRRYGDPDPGVGPFDPDRDEMALRLVDAMIAAGKPVFGVCRGFQELNVAFGGSLRRDMAEHPDLLAHHAAEDADLEAMFAHAHEVALTPGGVLSRSFGQDRIRVNSVHFQGVDRLGEGLRVEARAPDGVVEAVSADPAGAPVLAVQWHPEWRTDANPQSVAFFHMLGRALRGEPLAMSAQAGTTNNSRQEGATP